MSSFTKSGRVARLLRPALAGGVDGGLLYTSSRVLSSLRTETSSTFGSSKSSNNATTRWYRRGPHSTAKASAGGGYRPAWRQSGRQTDDEEWYDASNERFLENGEGGHDERRRVLRERWEMEVRERVDRTTGEKKAEKPGGQAYRPEKNKNKYKRGLKKQAFIMENNGEKKRNATRKRVEERLKMEERWRRMKTFAEDPNALTLERCEACKKFFMRYQGECTKCSEKDKEENTMGGL